MTDVNDLWPEDLDRPPCCKRCVCHNKELDDLVQDIEDKLNIDFKQYICHICVSNDEKVHVCWNFRFYGARDCEHTTFEKLQIYFAIKHPDITVVNYEKDDHDMGSYYGYQFNETEAWDHPAERRIINFVKKLMS